MHESTSLFLALHRVSIRSLPLRLLKINFVHESISWNGRRKYQKAEPCTSTGDRNEKSIRFTGREQKCKLNIFYHKFAIFSLNRNECMKSTG